MSEYFEISFLFKNDKKVLNNIKKAFEVKLNIREKENYIKTSNFKLLKKREALLLYYNFEKTDFYQFIVCLPSQIFHRDSFNVELEQVCTFVDFCLGLNDEILYALCSYELNVYLLDDVYTLNSIDQEVIARFPIAFTKKTIKTDILPSKQLRHSNLFINHGAQDLFSVM
jgi:hypothetical protein